MIGPLEPGVSDRYQLRLFVLLEDVSVFGNVHYLTFFRWQAECRDVWLKRRRPDLWSCAHEGRSRVTMNAWTTKFEHPFGIALGDDALLELCVAEVGPDRFLGDVEFFRVTNFGRERVASGRMEFSLESQGQSLRDWVASPEAYSCLIKIGLGSRIDCVDLVAWQGRCRELFLTDYAPEVLARVRDRRLVLQTSRASLTILQAPSWPVSEVRVEMSLDNVKCGQVSVGFRYFVESPSGGVVCIAIGGQKLSSKRLASGGLVPCVLPSSFLHSLRPFARGEDVLSKLAEIAEFSSSRSTAE